MTVIIRIPSSLRHWLNGKTEFLCQGRNVFDCIDKLNEHFPGIKSNIYDEEGNPSSILMFLNGDNIRNLEGMQTTVSDGDEITIIPLAAGG